MSIMSAAPTTRHPQTPDHVIRTGDLIAAAVRVAPTGQPTVFARYITAGLDAITTGGAK